MTQYFLNEETTPTQKDPNKALWSICLAQGVNDALKGNSKALDWIFAENDPHRIGSYLWICQALDIHPDRIKNWLKEQKDSRYVWMRLV